jgi:hypothetical protein
MELCMPSLLWLFLACSNSQFEVSGSPDGSDFTAVSGYWGNQFILFVDQEISCIDMWWVQTFNLQGEEPPTNTDLRALQITYNNEDEQIFEGTYSIGGEAPIKTEFLEITGETFNVSRATEGILELDEKIDATSITGGLNFVFSEGSVVGTFEGLTWCNNIKP